ncbi:MAG: hypothetical protein F6J93_17410 [Oscillatoria sp. SIO1A7]|nr:hypothetical protein [Oscillatoria sp. SIO1A7]
MENNFYNREDFGKRVPSSSTFIVFSPIRWQFWNLRPRRWSDKAIGCRRLGQRQRRGDLVPQGI